MREISVIKQRILDFLEKSGISKYECYKNTGITNGVLSQNNGMSEDNTLRFLTYYKEISVEWLLTGEGPMLKKEQQTEVLDEIPVKQTQIQLLHHPKATEKILSQQCIPVYNVEAAANLKTIFDNKDQNILGEITMPNIPRCDGAIYVRGDSMYPLLKSGDIVGYKEIFDFSNMIFGEMYIIAFDIEGDEYVTVKFINHSDHEGFVKLVSQNTYHDPKEIEIEKITAMALVKFSIRMNTMA